MIFREKRRRPLFPFLSASVPDSRYYGGWRSYMFRGAGEVCSAAVSHERERFL
ncbi:hypothetical protein HMPREF3038_00946 [Akkermansia sp. KLE1797]|nr:hypothetical protein HMPREF3038_00946 [Akkermansia sp. KLE1797]KXU54405.1 hypothetical protein HMPREF3039_01297 [Akkermansia sp. KLE1798]KZA04797.1 hypothetical protein HMPREF1326_01374 [Akkermansia sp. KLE1605]